MSPKPFVTLPNPYLDDVSNTSGRAALIYGLTNALAVTRLMDAPRTTDYLAFFVHTMVGSAVGVREDETVEEALSRGARSVLWSLSLAVRSNSDQGVDFTEPDPVSDNDGCNCGADHVAQQKTFDDFFSASIDGNPDVAVSVVVTAVKGDTHRQLPVPGFIGPMDANHAERYYIARLTDRAVECTARKMFNVTD